VRGFGSEWKVLGESGLSVWCVVCGVRVLQSMAGLAVMRYKYQD
jgi:ribosomal protein S27E